MQKAIDLQTNLTEQANHALQAARGRTLEVAGSASEEMRVVFESDDFSVSASGTDSRLGLRSIQDGRVGFVCTNSIDPAKIQAAVEESFQMGHLSPPSPHYSIAEATDTSDSEFSQQDGALLDMREHEIIGLAERVIEEARTDPRIRLDRVEVALIRDTKILMNTNGLSRTYSRIYVDWAAMGMARDGEEVTSFDYDGAAAFKASDIPARLSASMERFRNSVLGSLHPRAGKSYKGKVLLHPALVRQFLIGTVTSNSSGKSQQDGTSPWKDRLGEMIAHPALSVFEDPTNLERLEAYTPFDREGLLTRRHDLVLDGRLNHIGQNLFSAARGSCQPTANASGGATSTPGVGFFNTGLSLEPIANSDLDQLLGNMGSGLLLKRFSGNADPSSGHFSGVAKNSYWIENGEIAYPVQEIMVSGNLFELIKELVAATAEQYEIMGGAKAPYVLVDGMSVTAG
ncbi:MAG: TldD/PmbA family protein [Leptospiraceae bacterium]|nr:TldD/PmbA family protein [Leptospiraceae bacterium]